MIYDTLTDSEGRVNSHNVHFIQSSTQLSFACPVFLSHEDCITMRCIVVPFPIPGPVLLLLHKVFKILFVQLESPVLMRVKKEGYLQEVEKDSVSRVCASNA
jgi:hypothetical protein